jgi:hypothetical protein
MTMTFTEQQLRESLRRTTTDLPDAGDRVAQVQHRVRRRRRRTMATVAAVAALAVLAVPVTRVVLDRQARVDVATPGTVAEQMDATMKYAAFVAWWGGQVAGVKPPAGWDAGVTGVTVTTTLPPTMCSVVSMAAGEPAGTQSAWVLGQGSVLSSGSGGFGVISTYLPWPAGVTSCDPRPSGTLWVDAPASRASSMVAGQVAFASTPDDPSRPALDVAAVYRAVPADRLTQHGRDVFAAYQAAIPTEYGSAGAQLDRVLAALGSWIGIAMSNQVLAQASPQTGPVVLGGGAYVGTAALPAGYSARWDAAAGTLCVQGSVGDSGVRHVSEAEFAASMETGSTAVPVAGPCASG